MYECRTLALIGSVVLRLSPDVSASLRNVGEMSQLTGLYCGWSDTIDQYFHVFSLPLLEKLQICGRFGHSPDAAVMRAEYAKLSRKLTLLALSGGTQTTVMLLLSQSLATLYHNYSVANCYFRPSLDVYMTKCKSERCLFGL